ncbi:unnamed protein product [Prorocentrum cordatum]|uniref:RRM domain-containing protein n=1 Tax=Prorocentrum cordatum TaxID=2364126 RepID=A0ABN9TFH2_9DINO|nr:unnamed protein product [Polarella glacialis]
MAAPMAEEKKATARVELRGFPPWTEVDDLKAVIDGCGTPSLDVRLQYKAELGGVVAVGLFTSLYEASAVAAQLNGFEFTPGYPLEAHGEHMTPEDAGFRASGLLARLSGVQVDSREIQGGPLGQ